MSKNGILKRGKSYSLRITVKDQNGAVASWDDVTNFKLVIYSENTSSVLKSFEKVDLTIDDPATGIGIADISGSETEIAKLELYIIEYKYKIGEEEIPEKGYWGRFIPMFTEKTHFV